MTRQICCAFLIGILCSSASAELTDVSGDLERRFLMYDHVSGTTTDLTGGGATEVDTVLYSNLDAGTGYVAFPAATGPIGADDYASTAGATDIVMETFGFVGGVGTAAGVMTFDFFDSTGTTLETTFDVALTSPGNFIYTITTTGITVPGEGIVQLSVDAGTDPTGGQFFLGDAGPTVGTEDVNFLGGGGGIYSHNFEIFGEAVPEPATASLFMLSVFGVLGLRRRV